MSTPSARGSGARREPIAKGHLDADCFYVSAERVRDSFLIGKPVGVLGNHGACVIAKSYEMKHAGVKTGMPVWEAVVECPEGVYIKRDFRWYEVLSRKMLEVIRELAPRVEYYSIDEFFFDAEPLQPGMSFQTLAETIRDRIWEETRVPVTVGIARSKTLAKLISDTAKPFGALAVLDPDAERAYLENIPVTEVSGIAHRRASKLLAFDIRTALDLALADRVFIRKLLTITGEALWYELNGESVQPLLTERPPHKVISRGGSFGAKIDDPRQLYGWLIRNTERLVEELDFHMVRAGRLEIWLSYWNGETRSKTIDLIAPTSRFDLLAEAGKQALRCAWIPGVQATRMHLLASKLANPGWCQMGLFDPPAERAEAIAKLKREVNARHGRFALRSGATLYVNDLYKDEAHGYDICDVRGKICF